jgi:hypothetical protein
MRLRSRYRGVHGTVSELENQIIRLFEQTGAQRVSDTMAFVMNDGCSSHKDLYMLKLDAVTRKATNLRIVFVEEKEDAARVTRCRKIRSYLI